MFGLKEILCMIFVSNLAVLIRYQAKKLITWHSPQNITTERTQLILFIAFVGEFRPA